MTMSALTVLIIRHAEKTGEESPGPGLTSDGQQDRKSLVVRGWQRAGAWAALFGTDLGNEYPKPNVIYAAKPNAEAGAPDIEPSQRPYETIKPLADRLQLVPQTEWAPGNETELVAATTSLTGVVLICWEHKMIVRALLPALLNGQVIPRVPSKWDGSRYDIVLRFDRVLDGPSWSFRQLFPRLLAGDSDLPMPVS
jgi:hypothetical protein